MQVVGTVLFSLNNLMAVTEVNTLPVKLETNDTSLSGFELCTALLQGAATPRSSLAACNACKTVQMLNLHVWLAFAQTLQASHAAMLLRGIAAKCNRVMRKLGPIWNPTGRNNP